MNLKDLKYIITVAETCHFGKAAKQCFVSQPTLSGQIKKLEQELGVTLFERTNRSVEVTPIGNEIIDFARQIMDKAESIHQLAQARQDPLAGALRVGAIPTLCPYLAPLILLPLRKRYPQIKLVLSEEMTDTLVKRLKKHEIDAALLATPVNARDFESVHLFDEPFWLAHPRQHWFYNRETISMDDLDNTELLLLSEGHCLAAQAMKVCNLSERKQQGDMADLRASSLETLLQMVGAGLGSTLVPALALRGSWTTDSGIVARKLELPEAFRRISLVFRSSFPRQKALEAFARIIMANLPNTVTPSTQVKPE